MNKKKNRINIRWFDVYCVCFFSFFYRKSQNAYGTMPNDSSSSVESSEKASENKFSTQTSTNDQVPGTSKRVGKKPSVVYCMHGNVNGEDCCDNGSTTVNIKQVDSKFLFSYLFFSREWKKKFPFRKIWRDVETTQKKNKAEKK